VDTSSRELVILGFYIRNAFVSNRLQSAHATLPKISLDLPSQCLPVAVAAIFNANVRSSTTLAGPEAPLVAANFNANLRSQQHSQVRKRHLWPQTSTLTCGRQQHSQVRMGSIRHFLNGVHLSPGAA
jgi:hypothetical protein